MAWNFERTYFDLYTTGQGLRIYDSFFANNTANDGGGAIYNWKASNHVEGIATLYVGGSSFANNKVRQGPGGAILSENHAEASGKEARLAASVEIYNSTFVDNISANKMNKDDKGNSFLAMGGSAIATRGFGEANEMSLYNVSIADTGNKANVNNVLLFKANPSHFIGIYNTALWDNNSTSLGCTSPLSGYSNIAWPDKMGTCGVAVSIKDPLFTQAPMRKVTQTAGDAIVGVDHFLSGPKSWEGNEVLMPMLVPANNSPLRDAGNPALCGSGKYSMQYLPQALLDDMSIAATVDGIYNDSLWFGGDDPIPFPIDLDQQDTVFGFDQDKLPRPQSKACDIGAWEISSLHSQE